MTKTIDYNKDQFNEMIIFWKDQYQKNGKEYTLEKACAEWIGLYGESFYKNWHQIHNIES